MDDEKGVKKPLLLSSLSAMKKKLLPPPFLAEVRLFSLLLALIFACGYGGLAAYNLHRVDHPCPCQMQAQSWFLQCYELEGEEAVAAAVALGRGIVWCSAPQAAAAAPALLLLQLARGGLGIRLRALALVALAAAAANHVMYFKILGILRASNPGELSLAEPVAVLFAAALDMLGFVAFLPGGDDE
ncbi:unnamed protein product [Urochloa decumbens]|uniref:Uncharacterized protein n=1 Tax=Urochloa decumbens TaxID=240449 RepID=A0ABC9H4R9_9POAL